MVSKVTDTSGVRVAAVNGELNEIVQDPAETPSIVKVPWLKDTVATSVSLLSTDTRPAAYWVDVSVVYGVALPLERTADTETVVDASAATETVLLLRVTRAT